MKKYILIFSAITAFWACERDTDTLGPDLNDLYGDFQVFEEFKASRTDVDFAAGENVTFAARFSKTVDWEVQVIGQTSGAAKVFTGKSKEIDPTVTFWQGFTTNLPMFKTEPCIAVVSVPSENFSDTVSNINVVTTRIPDGYIIADFEDGLNAGVIPFVQSGADMRVDTVQASSSPQGFAFYEFTGDVSFADDLGNFMITKDAFIDTGFTLTANDGIVYFNVFAKRSPPPTSVNDIIVFQFMEDDNGNGVFDENSGDDLYEFVMSGLSENWELKNVVYADLVNDAPKGNGVKNPENLIGIRVLPIGLKEPFSCFIDYMVITENQPFTP